MENILGQNGSKDYSLRDQMIFGGKTLDYVGGIERFDSMSVETAEQLVDLGFMDPMESASELAPTVKEFVEFAKMFDELPVKLGGYVVSPSRRDVRVVIDSVCCDDRIPRNDMKRVREFAGPRGGSADEYNLDSNGFYAWWD